MIRSYHDRMRTHREVDRAVWTPILVMAVCVAALAAGILVGKVEPYRAVLTIPVVLVLGLIASAGFGMLSSASGGG